MAATLSCSQAIWFTELLEDLQQQQTGTTEICCDNKSTISMTKNLVFHSRTKNIDSSYQFLHDLVSSGIISLDFCGTNKHTADFF